MQQCLNLDDVLDDSVQVSDDRKSYFTYKIAPGGIARPQFGTSEFKPNVDRLKLQRQKRRIKENFPDFTKYVSTKYKASQTFEAPAPQKRARAQMQQSLYDILQVDVGCSEEVIRTSFRKLSAKLHPDKGGSATAFCELKKAYEVLSCAELRKVYDEEGLSGVEMLMSVRSLS
mmetsp:Transcript_21549/g.39411  ORF Transcript_21549/g.39411 Transcript_21549/m.39411 type:complete len:173 (+) Transcript_21549:2109-2627(+)